MCIRDRVTATLAVAFAYSLGLAGQSIADCPQSFVSGEKGWLGPYPLTGTLAGGELKLSFTVPEGDTAVVDFDATLHGAAFATALPVLQVLLRPEGDASYADLSKLRLDKARLAVTVDGIKTLNLENDFGTLSPKKAFQPFGPQPVKGSRCKVG